MRPNVAAYFVLCGIKIFFGHNITTKFNKFRQKLVDFFIRIMFSALHFLHNIYRQKSYVVL